MKEFHGTKGKWTYSPQKGIPGHCHCAQVWDSTGHNLATIEPTIKSKEATANARLIAYSQELAEALQHLITLELQYQKIGYIESDLIKKSVKRAQIVINKALGL